MHDIDPKPDEYTPVSYALVHDRRKMREKLTTKELRKGWIERAENLLNIHKQRAVVNDGLSGLSEREVIAKVRDAPTKLKANMKELLHRLQKLNVKLDDEGEIDYSEVDPKKEKEVRAAYKNDEPFIKTCLMLADLEFEYPQKLEKMRI